MICAPAKIQNTLGIHTVWAIFTVNIKKPGVQSCQLCSQQRLRPQGYKTFFMLNTINLKFQMLIKTEMMKFTK